MATRITNERPKDFKVNVLGEEWVVTWRTKEEDVHLLECNGYSDETIRTIVIEWYEWDGRNLTNMADYTAKVLRHELVHAMLYESGLGINTDKEWARNEEMVDWIAIQLPMMAKTILTTSDKILKEVEKDLTIID